MKDITYITMNPDADYIVESINRGKRVRFSESLLSDVKKKLTEQGVKVSESTCPDTGLYQIIRLEDEGN